MVETMKRANGIGLAAPQVGVALKVAVIQLPEWKEPVVLINPEMDEVEGARAIQESCLSVPKFRNLVHRSERVKVKALGPGRQAGGDSCGFALKVTLAPKVPKLH